MSLACLQSHTEWHWESLRAGSAGDVPGEQNKQMFYALCA